MRLHQPNMFRYLWLVATLALFCTNLVAQRDSSAIKKCIPSPDVYKGQAVYRVADKMPVFGKEASDLMRYISQNLIYKEGNKESPLRSTFRVTCIIDTIGQVQDVCCITSLDYEEPVEKQMMALIQNSTGWAPAMMNDKKVCVRLIIPITICLK
jgi:hypothetical protein